MAAYIILNKKVRSLQPAARSPRTRNTPKVEQVIKLYVLIGHGKNKYESQRYR